MAQHREVISTGYPYLPIQVEVQAQSEEALALLDTGYTGSVIIPAILQRRGLGLLDGRTAVEVGDGRPVFAPVYLGTIEIADFDLMYGIAITMLGSEYILGRRILDRCEITLGHGQQVMVRP